MVPSPRVVLNDVWLSYKRDGRAISVLRGVGLRACSGVTLLYGRSGSGKSTLLSLIAGLLRPDRGRVVVDGIEVSALGWGRLSWYRRRMVGYAMQQNIFLPRSTVLFNIMLPLLIAGHSWAAAEEAARLAAEELGLGGLLDARAYMLSGGEARRLVVARALASGRPLLLLDEPTSSLDKGTGEAVWRAIASRGRESTVIVATHDEAGLGYASSVYRVEDGRVECLECPREC